MIKKNALVSIVTMISLSLFCSHSYGVSFVNLTQNDVDKVMKEMSANTAMHSVLPPSSLGAIWGFELGLAAGQTKSPNINDLSKRIDSTTNLPSIYHAGLLGAVTVPLGITVETTLFPKTSQGDLSYGQTAFGVKWTVTDVFMTDLPVNLAVRGFTARSEVEWKQTQGVNTFKASSDVNTSGLEFLISPKLIPFVEPYFGLGLFKSTGKLSQNGSAPLPVFTDGSQSKESNLDSQAIIVGLDARLLMFGAGVEYMKSFDTESLSTKLSLKF